MKKTILSLLLLATTAIGISSCGHSTNAQAQQNNNVTRSQAPPQDIDIKDNQIPDFDVNAFAALLKQTSNAAALEQAINTPDNPVNHLHLNDPTGVNIDYVKVDQISGSQMKVYDETPSGKVEIATLDINSNNNSYQVNGSPTYCGSDPSMYSYHSQPGITLGQLMFLSWMMSPHPYYHPGWGYGRGYYGGYHPYRYNPAYRNSYRTSYRTTYRTTYVKNNPAPRQQVRQAAPAQQRATAPAPSPARNVIGNTPQRQFQRNSGRDASGKAASTNAFRNPSSSSRPSPSPSRPSPSRTSPTRSSGGFGGGGRGRR